MTQEIKNRISDALRERMNSLNLSQGNVANAIGGISDTAINFIYNKKYIANEQAVSEKFFNKVASWLGLDDEWVIVREDYNIQKVVELCRDAKRKSTAFAIADGPGMGKSVALKMFANVNANTYYIRCSKLWGKKMLLQAVKKALGLSVFVQPVADMFDDVITCLSTKSKPLVIFDEADKCGEFALHLFHAMSDALEGSCGFIMCGSKFFQNNVEKGVAKEKQGYSEAYSRFGSRFYNLKSWTPERIKAICKANGVNDGLEIQKIINTNGNDARNINRKCAQYKVKESLGKEDNNNED